MVKMKFLTRAISVNFKMGDWSGKLNIKLTNFQLPSEFNFLVMKSYFPLLRVNCPTPSHSTILVFYFLHFGKSDFYAG